MWIIAAQKEFQDVDEKELEESLCIYFDENNILRRKGRLSKSKLPNSTCNHIIIAKTPFFIGHKESSTWIDQRHTNGD